LKLIRLDYVKDDLLLLDESNLEKVANFVRPTFGELVNSVSVSFWDNETSSEGAVTVQDIALVQMQGATINTTFQYPGFTNRILATYVAQRELKNLSTPAITCTLYANRDAFALTLGDAFRFSWADYEVDDVVMRVTSIAYGDGKSNKVRITCTQDIFSLPDRVVFESPPVEWEDPDLAPQNTTNRIVFEAPYMELVYLQGQTTVDTLLATNVEVGFVSAAALRPQDNAPSAAIMIDEGAGWVEEDTLYFCPGAFLDGDIGYLDDTIPIQNAVDTDDFVAGSWCQIGNEIMLCVALTATEMTVKRGCLDTVPVPHSDGDVVYLWAAYADIVEKEYVESDALDVRLLTETASSSIEIADAPNNVLTFVGRASRPYPPAQVKVNASYYPSAQLSSIELTWVHRNRIQQTGGTILGFEDEGVTIESGVTYRVRLFYSYDTATPFFTHTGITGISYEVPPEEIPWGESAIYIELAAMKDGRASYQLHFISVNLAANIGDDILFEMDDTSAPPDGDDILFEMT